MARRDAAWRGVARRGAAWRGVARRGFPSSLTPRQNKTPLSIPAVDFTDKAPSLGDIFNDQIKEGDPYYKMVAMDDFKLAYLGIHWCPEFSFWPCFFY